MEEEWSDELVRENEILQGKIEQLEKENAQVAKWMDACHELESKLVLAEKALEPFARASKMNYKHDAVAISDYRKAEQALQAIKELKGK